MFDGSWNKNHPRCVLANLGQCIARVPEACQCIKMPVLVYIDALKAQGVDVDQTKVSWIWHGE